jgi:peptidoglycan/LPS O-acetylase OafA/YrhL
MWARISEILLACWLALSPFILVEEANRGSYLLHDFGCAAAIAGFALLSFWPRFGKAHLCTLAVAAWLVGIGFAQPDPPPPLAYQNCVVVGALLIMFVIVPSHASEPPRRWREFYHQRKR